LAAKAFENVLILAPKSSKVEMAKIMLGLCHWKSGDRARAKAYFEEALRSKPDSEYRSLVLEYLEELEK